MGCLGCDWELHHGSENCCMGSSASSSGDEVSNVEGKIIQGTEMPKAHSRRFPYGVLEVLGMILFIIVLLPFVIMFCYFLYLGGPALIVFAILALVLLGSQPKVWL